MKLNLITNVSLRIILIFVVAMLVSFIPDIPFMREFFGDTWCSIENKHYCGGPTDERGPHYVWAYRHWLWAILGFILAIIQIMSIIFYAERKSESI